MTYSAFNGDGYFDLDLIAFEGKCRIFVESNNFSSVEKSRDYLSEVLNSPTWGEIFLHSLKSQQKTLDFSHSYFEGFTECGEADGVRILRLFLGS